MVKYFYKKNYLSFLLTLCLSAIIIMLIIHPEKYVTSVYNGMLLFAVNVLPALFPFFFLTKLLTSLGTVQSFTNLLKKPVQKLFKLPSECSYIFFMSIISGYPIGAKLISEFYGGSTDRNLITRMAAVCSTSGPLFIIGTLGFSMLGNKTAGFIIYAAHIISILLFAFISGLFAKHVKIPENAANYNYTKSSDKILSESIYSSVISIFIVGGFISIFYMFIDMLGSTFLLGFFNNILSYVFGLFNLPSELSMGLLNGIVEITRGCLDISASAAPLSLKMPFCAFLITFGGACIMLQSFAFLGRCKIKYSKYIIYKFIQSVSAAIICILMCNIFNI